MLRITSSRNKPAHCEAKIRPTSMFKFYSRIEQAYSQLLKTTVSNSKFDMINQRLKNVRHASFRVIWLKNHDKNLEGHKNCECYVSKKIQENNFVFSNCFFFLSFFFFFFSCAHYFFFAFLTIIRTTKRQRTHVNKASKINKIITMSSWRNQDKKPYRNF